MAILHIQTLIDKGACDEQVGLFRRTVGESVDITPEWCESVANLFSWDWGAVHLLSPTAQAEYERVTGGARAEYRRIKAAAAALAEYERVGAAALAEYRRIKAAARAEYRRVCVRAFGAAYCEGSAALIAV